MSILGSRLRLRVCPVERKVKTIRTLIFFLIFAFGLSVLSVGCCADGKVDSKANKTKPVFDQEVGVVEKEILHKYGEPKQTIVT